MNPLYRIRKIIFSIAKFKSSKIHLKIMAYLTTYSILAGVFALLYFAWKKLQRGGCHGPLPPGPLGWPVIGNLLTLASGTRNQRLAEIGTKFGGIFTLKMGVSRTVWVTSYKIFREAVVDHSCEFAGRPQKIWASDETTDRNPGIISSGVDDVARQVRKFSLVALRSFGFGKSTMQDFILQQSDELNDELRKHLGQPFNPHNAVATAASNVIAAVAFGRTYKQGDPALLMVNDEITNGIRQILLASRDQIFPFLQYIPMIFKSRQELNSSFQTGKRFLVEIVEEHITSREPGQPRDFVDVWLDENAKNSQSAEYFPVEKLPNVLLDLFAAGFETTTTTFSWLFALLLNHPDVQDKIHQELDGKLGHGVPATLETRDSVPYTEAVILETLRMFPVAPLAIPHMATEDATLAGRRIPKGTRLIIHIYSIHHDHELWTDPEVFRPERFIHNGAIKTPDFFVPFGMGRRSCLGEQLARKELFLLFANMLRRFRLVLPAGAGPPSLEMMQSVVMYPPPFDLVLEER